MYFYFNPFSVRPRFYDIPLHFNAHVYTCMYTCFRCSHNQYYANVFLPSFAEVKVLKQQNMLNVHHVHNLDSEMFKWNYEQHLYTHTFIPMGNRFASLDVL